MNVLRQIPDSLDSVASGIACYIAFCDLMGLEYFPPTSYRLRQRSVVFRPGKCFGLYVSHVRKACQILNLPISFDDALLKGVIKGLEHAQEKSDEFPNIVDLKLLIKIIDHEGIDSQFALLSFFSFLYLLRVPSEGLCMKRARFDHDLVSRRPLDSQSILGIVDDDSAPKLVLKLKKRKNAKMGMILIRPCLCQGSIINPRNLCPVHRIWPIIKRTIRPGDFIFPQYVKSNINRIIKAVMAKLSIPDSELYTSKCFRRGCSNAMKDSDSTLGQIMRAAGWNAAGYRSYLLLQQDEEKFIASLIRALEFPDSEDEID